jgi:hypothetical protein
MLVLRLPKIEFGYPRLYSVKRKRKWMLEGVAFVEGFDKAVGFVFHSGHSGNLSLELEDLYQAKDVYNFFKGFLIDISFESGLSKSFSKLYSEWNGVDDREEILQRIEKAMGSNWSNAFLTILSVYDK